MSNNIQSPSLPEAGGSQALPLVTAPDCSHSYTHSSIQTHKYMTG